MMLVVLVWIVLMGGVLFWIVRRYMLPRKPSTKPFFPHLLRDQIGLVPAGDALVGNLDGVRVGVTGVGNAYRLYTHFEPPLDLGLCIADKPDELSFPFGRGVALVSGVRLDVRADEPERARALFGPDTCDELRRLKGIKLVVSDWGATATVSGPNAHTHRVRELLDALAAFTRAVHRERALVPAAARLRSHAPAWQRFAEAHRLSVLNTPLCLFGRIEDATVYAYSVRVGDNHHHLEVWLRFEEPLRLGLLVQPARAIDRMRDLWGQQDVEVGDDLFDDEFIVRTSDEDGTRALLGAEVQGILLNMHHTVGPLTLTDEGISTRIPFVPHTPMHVPKVVGQLIALAGDVEARRGRHAEGPYR